MAGPQMENYYCVIACKDGSTYISHKGFPEACDALLDGERNLHPGKDVGVVGVFQIATIHQYHPCLERVPIGQELAAKEWAN